ITLRVRNISCQGIAVGSGWAVDPHTLITNRHVIAGAAVIELDAWDGTSVQADVSRAASGRLVDIGVVRVAETLPAVASTGPEPAAGAAVTAVGYPLGGPLTLSPGRVLGYVDGRSLPPGIGFDGRVIEISAAIHHGNSGGPLLDSRGRVVGVVYAAQFAPGAAQTSASQIGYAIPLSEVGTLLAAGGSQAIVPCAG
ncbi:MAG TPA: trypsin-like peptidase domain-containing protein, partial [Solirubrobacteraceae bacterium]|nr:trypsin-like peptidase domain-containing protein [Solirubrobacteraceae bacterium]